MECNWHFAKFDLRTGHALGLPATADLRTYPVLRRRHGGHAHRPDRHRPGGARRPPGLRYRAGAQLNEQGLLSAEHQETGWTIKAPDEQTLKRTAGFVRRAARLRSERDGL